MSFASSDLTHCLHPNTRASPSRSKKRTWTAFWTLWVSEAATRPKVTPTRPLWAPSRPSMKWDSRCICSWTTPLAWPPPSQRRATTTTITTTLTAPTTPATAAPTWTGLPARPALWTTPMELFSGAPRLGRTCTSVASPNRWVLFFDVHVYGFCYVSCCGGKLVDVIGSTGIQVYPAAWYGFGVPASPYPPKKRSPTWNFTKTVNLKIFN